MNEININEIVKIEQMPKVFSQLEKIGELIDKKTSDLNELECTDNNKQEVKNRKAEINKTLEVLEERRIEIKNKLLEPYKTFEEKYNNECKIKLQKASDLLKNKIDEIEKKQKQNKEDELRMFAEQWFISKGIEDIVAFEDIGLNITLSASMKSLKEQIIEFCEKVFNDLKLIELEEYSDEILLEYKKCKGNFAHCKINVIERHRQLEEIQKQQEMKQEQEKQEEQVVEKVDEIVTPKEIIENDELITVSFKVTGTKEKIKKIKELIIELGVEYE